MKCKSSVKKVGWIDGGKIRGIIIEENVDEANCLSKFSTRGSV